MKTRGVKMKGFLIATGLLLFSQNAFCWGSLGHKTAAQVAWRFIDKETRNKLSHILNGQSLADVSVWADSARAEEQWKFTIWYHFEKAPDNYTYLDNLKRQDEKYRKLGGLLEALYIAEDMFRSPKSTGIEKENAIKFLVHFIADIHQPLHTGRVEDNSGNKIPIKWLGLDLNLHQIWDSQIIYLAHKDILGSSSESEQAVAYSNYLLTKFKDFKITPDLFHHYDDWMHESMVPRVDAYKYMDESEQKYTARFSNVIDMRVYLAGLRIAQALTRIVGEQIRPEPLTQLRDSVVKIVGNFSEFVSLVPRSNTAR